MENLFSVLMNFIFINSNFNPLLISIYLGMGLGVAANFL